MSKKYCIDCKYFKSGELIPFSYGPPQYDRERELCMSPNNFKDTHKKTSEIPISTPHIINRFNNCIWYEKYKEDDSSSSSSSSINNLP